MSDRAWGQDSSGWCFPWDLALWLSHTQNQEAGGIPKTGMDKWTSRLQDGTKGHQEVTDQRKALIRWNFIITMWHGWRSNQGIYAWGPTFQSSLWVWKVQMAQNYRKLVSSNLFGAFTSLQLRYDPTEKRCHTSRERNNHQNAGTCELFRTQHCWWSSWDSMVSLSEI
jgi:hypothetical protein